MNQSITRRGEQDGQPSISVSEQFLRELEADITAKREKAKQEEQELNAQKEQLIQRDHMKGRGLVLAIASLITLAILAGLAMYRPLSNQPDPLLMEEPIAISQVAAILLLVASAIVLVNLAYLSLAWIMNNANSAQLREWRTQTQAQAWAESKARAYAQVEPVTLVQVLSQAESLVTALQHIEKLPQAQTTALIGIVADGLKGALNDVKTLVSDKTAPATTCEVWPQANRDDWNKTDVTVTLSPNDNDGSGVKDTYYKMGNGDLQTYSEPFRVAGDGQHTITYWSVDRAGNNETPNERTVSIDRGQPNIKLTGLADPAIYKLNEQVTIDCTCTDDGSLVATCNGAAGSSAQIKLDTSSPGKKAIEVIATDFAGNEARRSADYTVS